MTSLRRVGLPALVGLLLLAGGLRMAAGYRLGATENVIGPFLFGEGEQHKRGWDPEVWGPGTTMTVSVPDDPRWIETFDYFESMADVRHLVSEAAALWSGIGTADIRWEVGQSPVAGEAGIVVVIKDLPEDWPFRGWARGRSKRNAGIWQVEGCEVVLDDREDNGLEITRRGMRWFFAHELGHCVGLSHHAEYPNLSWLGLRYRTLASMWGGSSIMGVPFDAGWVGAGALQPTERIGASLLRPAPGWLESTGAIYGTVLGADFGSEMAGVGLLAARVGLDGRPRDAVTRVTNLWGQFTVEGLAPGEYVLMLNGFGLDSYGENWVGAARIHKTIRLDPVRVRAGGRTGPIVLTARRPAEENVP